MSRRPGLFNEALAGFFRSTEATAKQRAEAVGHHAPRRSEPPALTVSAPPDDQTDIDWLSASTADAS